MHPALLRPALRARVVLPAVLVISLFAITADAQSPRPFQEGWNAGVPVSLSGVLTTVYADDFAHGRAELLHSVVDQLTGKGFLLRFETAPPAQLRSGMRVTVRGRVHESEIYVAAADGTSLTIQGSVITSTSTTGQRTLVMVANFRDATVTCSIACITDTMFTNVNGLSVANLYLTDSRGSVSLSGEVVGPYGLNVAAADPCDLGEWAAAADAQASAAGIDVSGYQHKVYVLPSTNTCTAAGYGTVGGSPSSAWIFKADTAGVFAHELGHNLGMDHASTPTSEYDDSTDPMAMATWMLHGVNAPHRHQLNWLGVSSLLSVSQAGLYSLAPLAMDPAAVSTPQVLLIAKPDTQEYYYLSYRTPIGFDNYIDGSFFNRLSVHRYKGDGSSTRTFRLAGLADGEQFVDAINGVTITLVSHDDTHAGVRVDFAASCGAAPALGLSPQAQNGPAGGAASYALSITNVDSASCPASLFSLSDSVPPGWAGSVSPTTVSLAPGATGQAVFAVTASPAAATGTYAVTGSVVNAGQSTSVASASGTYTVQSNVDTVAPLAPSGLKASVVQKQKQIQLSWTAASDNVAVAGYLVSRDGTIVATVTTASWADTAWKAGAMYTYTVFAYDAAKNVSAPSNTATVNLSSGSGKKR